MPLIALSRAEDPGFTPVRLDVRGWPVKTRADNEKVGVVHDVLVDEDGTPRYLDVDLGLFRKHVLLPVGQARADRETRTVWVPGYTRRQFRHIPAYDHDLTRVTPEYETGLVSAYARAETGSAPRPPYAGAVYGPSELEDRLRPARAGEIVPMERLAADGFRVRPDEADPRGWTVLGADGRPIGRVEELLADTGTMKVRYLVCRIDEEGLGLERQDRRVLIPAGFARLDEPNRHVLVDVITGDDVARLPVYPDSGVRRDLEDETIHAFRNAPNGFYRDPRFDPREFYGPDAA